MFRILLILAVLTGYGGCSMLGSAPDPEDATGAPAKDLRSLASSALHSAQSLASGVSTTTLPPTGCELDTRMDHLDEILSQVPEAQRAALAQLLNSTQAVWTTQIYRGELGLGVCIPTQNMLILLPVDGTASSSALLNNFLPD